MLKKHIVSTVFNAVEGDSRVIKTAQVALDAGYNATIVGVCNGSEVVRKEVEGVPVVLMPNFAQQLKKQGLWGSAAKDLRLLVGGQLRSTVPEIISLQPDIIHSHDMIGLKIGAAASKSVLAGGRIVPWVHDIHEFVAGLKGDLAEKYMPICLAWEREYLHTADQLLTVSDTLADVVQKRYFLKKRPQVVFNTPAIVDSPQASYDLRTELGLSKNDELVVFVGGATPLRGCDTILEAVSYLKGVHLAFVSQGKYVEELSIKASELGMAERFHVHPYVPSSQVSSFISSADVGIHGLIHYPNAEVAMPNKMFEYLHAGLPIVVSDVESMKEFVENNKVGCSFIAGDSHSCAASIQHALDKKAFFANNITLELKRAYSWEAQAEKIKIIYEDLLSRNMSSPEYGMIKDALVWEKIDMVTFESAYAQSLASASLEKISNIEKFVLKGGNNVASGNIVSKIKSAFLRRLRRGVKYVKNKMTSVKI